MSVFIVSTESFCADKGFKINNPKNPKIKITFFMLNLYDLFLVLTFEVAKLQKNIAFLLK